jgi:predicted MFS family arabinose efflux permease
MLLSLICFYNFFVLELTLNPWRGLKEIPRNIWLLSFTTLINRSGTMVLPYLILYLTKHEGISASSAGMVLSFYGAGALITSPFVGRLSDKIGALTVMRVSLLFTGIIVFLYSFVHSFELILIVTLIWSVISEAFRPANLALISMEASVDQRKTAFALNRLAINLGMSIGPVIGGFLAMMDFSLLFYVNGVMTLSAWLFLYFSKFDLKHKTAGEKFDIRAAGQDQVNSADNQESVLKDRTFIYFLLALIPVELVFFQHIGAMPLYIVRNLHYTESTFGLLMAINTVLIIFIEVPLNNIMNNWDDRKLSALGALLCGLGYGAMLFSTQLEFLVFTIIIWTFGEMIFFPASASFISAISPENKRGEYMGYFQVTFSFSLMVGPWLGTIVLDNFGAPVLWISTFILSLISMTAFLMIRNSSPE